MEFRLNSAGTDANPDCRQRIGRLAYLLDAEIAFDRAEFNNMAGRLVNAGVESGFCSIGMHRDATRLLRVQGTWNFKYATDNIPATPVTLDYCSKEHIYRSHVRLIEEAGAVQDEDYSGGNGARGTGGVDAHGLPLDENDDLTGGMKKDYPPDIDEVAKYCQFIGNTIDAGGARMAEPLWNTVLRWRPLSRTRKKAHRMSREVAYDSEAGPMRNLP